MYSHWLWEFCVALCPFLFCNHLEQEEKAGCFAIIIIYRCIVTISVLRLFLTVPWVCLRFEIVVFPDHTHLHMYYFCVNWECSGTTELLHCPSKDADLIMKVITMR